MANANSTSNEIYASELQGDSGKEESKGSSTKEPKTRPTYNSVKDQGNYTKDPASVFGMPVSQPFIVSNPVNRSYEADMSLGYANISQHPAQVNSFASPAFMLQNSRIVGEASMSTSFLQEATHILNLYNHECHQKLLLF
jgi:hypothetical protein